jgi:hypothetical protein
VVAVHAEHTELRREAILDEPSIESGTTLMTPALGTSVDVVDGQELWGGFTTAFTRRDRASIVLEDLISKESLTLLVILFVAMR